jgi:hypothetical protein
MGAVWFYGESIIIDSISIFVLILIAFFSIKYYQIKKSRQSLFLALAFIMLALSFGMEMFINSAVKFTLLDFTKQGYGQLSLSSLSETASVVFIIYFIYHAITLIGYYLFYAAYDKQSVSNFMLVIYLIFALLFFSHESLMVFYLNSSVMLLLVTGQAFVRYQNRRYPATRFLVYGLGIITASQIASIFSAWDAKFYVMGEIIQLVGFMTLLVTFIAVLIYGRKKDEDRYNW